MKTRILILATGLLFAFTTNAQRKLSRDKIQITKTKNAKVLGTDTRGNVFDNSEVLDTLATLDDIEETITINMHGVNTKFILEKKGGKGSILQKGDLATFGFYDIDYTNIREKWKVKGVLMYKGTGDPALLSSWEKKRETMLYKISNLGGGVIYG